METEKDEEALPHLKRALGVDPANEEAASLLYQIQNKPPPIVRVRFYGDGFCVHINLDNVLMCFLKEGKHLCNQDDIT